VFPCHRKRSRRETLKTLKTRTQRGVEHPGDVAEAASLSSIALPP
jgi:hypothetical protein